MYVFVRLSCYFIEASKFRDRLWSPLMSHGESKVPGVTADDMKSFTVRLKKHLPGSLGHRVKRRVHFQQMTRVLQ